MKKYVGLIIFIGVIIEQSASENVESRIVNIKQGPVRGYLNEDRSVYSFYSIPYATAPTGSHRFRAPLPPPVWDEPFEAIDRRIICPQMIGFEITDVFDMKENCLITNVFVPNTIDTNLPVLVSIHGGAFIIGFGNQQQYNSLVKMNKLIVVSFNYRLGAHGFLCLGTEDAPGNAGMKDQVSLLRWVQANIASFGGNPNDVTLVGCSAGGSSVHTLLLSKMTDGLFKKAIPESGASIGGAGVQVDPLESAKIYAKTLNFTEVDDINSLEQFYKTASYQLLTSGLDTILNRRDSFVLFSPCIERDIGVERFLEDSPQNLFRKGHYKKLPLLYGFTQMESLILRLPNFYDWKDDMNKKFSDFLPLDLHFDNETHKEQVAETVKSFYFGNLPVGEATILNYLDYFSDVMFIYPMLNTLKWHIEYNNDTIYLYEYTFTDENTPLVPYTDVRGADHCEQAVAVLDEDKTDATAEYRNMKTTMRSLWLNFILNGNPRSENVGLPAWTPVSSNRSPHMSLGRTIELKGVVLEQRAAFWDRIYQQYYRDPIPPPAPSSKVAVTLTRLWILMLITCYII